MKIKKYLKNKIKYISIFSIVILFGCSYNFSEDNFVNIEIPSTDENFIIFKNFKTNDTINTVKTIEYNFNSSVNQNTLESKVYLDNEEINSNWNSNLGSFIVRPSRYTDGIHTLKITHIFTSGSGSIKDQVSREFLTKSETFKFVVKRKPSSPPSITSVTIENGSIKIKWNKPNNDDYENAFLSLKFKYSEKRIPLTDVSLNSNEFIDTSTILLVGPENSWRQDIATFVEYSIVYQSKYEELFGGSKRLTFDPNWINLKISYIDSDSYKIQWEKFPLYNNVKEFTIGFTNFRFNGSTLGGEKIINEPYVFGKKYTASVSFENFSVYFLTGEIKLDTSSFSFFDVISNHQIKEILYNPSKEKYYALVQKNSSHYIYEYSKEMKLLRENYITNDFAYSAYGAPPVFHLNPINNNFHLETRNGSFEIDKNSLNVVEKYIDTNTQASFLTVLRNDILYKYNIGSFSLFLEVKNIKTNNIIFSGKINAPRGTFLANGGTLSNDGKYLHIPNYSKSEGTIYKIVNDNLEKIMDIDGAPRVKFYENKVLYEFNKTVYLIDLDSKFTQSFKPFNERRLIKYDPLSNKVLSTKDGAAEIYDFTLRTSQLFNYEETKDERSHEEYHYVFMQNNKLIYSKGMYFDNY